MDNHQEDDALWNLLGQARETKASPYFARKVLRSIRLENEARKSKGTWMPVLRWFLPTSALAALLIGWAVVQWDEEKDAFAAEFNAVAELSSLVALENTAPWMDLN
jgi:hypothetical protein